MYLIPIAWLYVALMMTVAEATSSNGSLLGAFITFLLYGALPIGLLLYILGTPARKRRLRAREAEALHTPPADADLPGTAPDARSETATDAVAPVRKEP